MCRSDCRNPNFYGILEDYTGVADMVHAAKALLIMTAPASTLGVIRTPENGVLTLPQVRLSPLACPLISEVLIWVTSVAARLSSANYPAV